MNIINRRMNFHGTSNHQANIPKAFRDVASIKRLPRPQERDVEGRRRVFDRGGDFIEHNESPECIR
ncbi:MAG: hypothetical protein A2Z14_18090 [Chloroflexi bacterium RBG_16_48_8]|nr:MAG: hypothetical protein A2Z14_18090 [Chloroflexi bacterium RBG_16_48_8]